MTTDARHDPTSAPLTRAGDGRTMIGHVVVCRGGGPGDVDALAVWHVDTGGARTGAWIVPVAEAFGDPAAARRLLASCRRRAVLAWDPADPIAILRELERTAAAPPEDWAASAVSIPFAPAEVASVRAACEKRVAEEQGRNKDIEDLEWEVALPDPLPGTPEELHRSTRQAVVVAPTRVATAALVTGRLAGWVVRRWRETAGALGRRDYLRAEFGEPTVLAPEWERRVADAYRLA